MARRTTNQTRWLLPTVLAAGALLIIFAYQLSAPSRSVPPRSTSSRQAAPTTPNVSLRLMSSFEPAAAGVMVAARAGVFDDEGLRLEIRPGSKADDPISSVADGSDTFGLTRADTFLLARAKGARTIAFAAGFIDSPIVFYALKQSGIRTPQDFAGHRIGYRVGDDSALMYDTLVAWLGLPQSRITQVPVTDDVSMLLRGDVDVWPGHVGIEDYALKERGADYNAVNPASYGMHLMGSVFFASEQTIAKQPQLVRRFLHGMIAGWNKVYGDSTTSVPMIVSFETRLTPEYVRFALDRQSEYVRSLAVRYGEFTDDQWRSLQAILLSGRRLDTTVNLRTAVNYEFLRDAYRKSLTISK
jgi:ABC-type nitrate/sulfonate/bicarbonate transport system substrate-binding protein